MAINDNIDIRALASARGTWQCCHPKESRRKDTAARVAESLVAEITCLKLSARLGALGVVTRKTGDYSKFQIWDWFFRFLIFFFGLLFFSGFPSWPISTGLTGSGLWFMFS